MLVLHQNRTTKPTRHNWALTKYFRHISFDCMRFFCAHVPYICISNLEILLLASANEMLIYAVLDLIVVFVLLPLPHWAEYLMKSYCSNATIVQIKFSTFFLALFRRAFFPPSLTFPYSRSKRMKNHSAHFYLTEAAFCSCWYSICIFSIFILLPRLLRRGYTFFWCN